MRFLRLLRAHSILNHTCNARFASKSSAMASGACCKIAIATRTSLRVPSGFAKDPFPHGSSGKHVRLYATANAKACSTAFAVGHVSEEWTRRNVSKSRTTVDGQPMQEYLAGTIDVSAQLSWAYWNSYDPLSNAYHVFDSSIYRPLQVLLEKTAFEWFCRTWFLSNGEDYFTPTLFRSPRARGYFPPTRWCH